MSPYQIQQPIIIISPKTTLQFSRDLKASPYHHQVLGKINNLEQAQQQQQQRRRSVWVLPLLTPQPPSLSSPAQLLRAAEVAVAPPIPIFDNNNSNCLLNGLLRRLPL